MLSLSALLLALVCVTSAQPLPEHSKSKKASSINWLDVVERVFENILGRHKGKMSLAVPVYVGKLFGTVGNSEEGLFEESGYNQMLFDNRRGKLNAKVYQKTLLKSLGIKGIESDVGAQLHWTKDNANVYVKLSKPISEKNTIVAVTVNGAGNIDLKKDKEVAIKKLDIIFALRNKSNAKKVKK